MSDESPQRPTSNDDRKGWSAYWTAQGMPWRTEPEIDEGRQAYLADRRAVKPDIERGIYPFRDVNGSIKLTRADVEWLLATHESDDLQGLVEWSEECKKPILQRRSGLDLRGADLRGTDLSHLPLTRLIGGIGAGQTHNTTRAQRRMAVPRLARANLYGAHLESAALARAELRDADLTMAHLEQADLYGAHLEGANLTRAHLEGAILRGALLDSSVYLYHSVVGNRQLQGFHVADTRWNGASLASVDWTQAGILGEEWQAYQRIAYNGKRKTPDDRLSDFERAVRANRQLAIALRGQGLNEHADRFAYRAQLCQRVVTRKRHRYLPYIGSLLLDLLAGYGYRPGRAILLYLAVIIWFANFYVWASKSLITLGLPPSHVQPLAWYEALILSVSSFHGRGFQPFQNLNDPVAALAGIQAVFGLVIEVSFIATFTQRFFGK